MLTVREVAERLGVCRRFVYDRLIATGELRHVRVRNAIRVEPADLEALIAAIECVTQLDDSKSARPCRRR